VFGLACEVRFELHNHVFWFLTGLGFNTLGHGLSSSGLGVGLSTAVLTTSLL